MTEQNELENLSPQSDEIDVFAQLGLKGGESPEKSDDAAEPERSTSDTGEDAPESGEQEKATSPSPDTDQIDEYGNEAPKKEQRMYSEEEVNERINKAVRERLARLEKNQPQQVQKEIKDNFEYDKTSEQDYQAQLETFIENTLYKVTAKKQQEQAKQFEAHRQSEFQSKFQAGMQKFPDFVETVSKQPITDPMTMALRAIADPAGFIYAASKRHPEELARIANIPDHYAQIAEIGKLEERMKKGKPTSAAPKPLRPTSEDMGGSIEKDLSIEQLIEQSNKKRLQALRRR